MEILNGKVASQKIRNRIAAEVKTFIADGKRKPHLAAILVGSDGASETYVGAKVRACSEIGFDSTLIRKEATITEKELLDEVDRINADSGIDGLIVQLPLPRHINERLVTLRIKPSKDVDGFHPENLGRLLLGLPGFVSATPRGILMLLEEYGIVTEGKHVVVLGRSNIVGTPVSLLLSRNNVQGNATVTLCHSKTTNIEEFTRSADIVIAALGIPGYLKRDMVKPGAVVVDVGITRVADLNHPKGYRIEGDADFQSLEGKVSWISPVPGGVGAMTIAALMQNTLEAYRRNQTDNA